MQNTSPDMSAQTHSFRCMQALVSENLENQTKNPSVVLVTEKEYCVG